MGASEPFSKIIFRLKVTVSSSPSLFRRVSRTFLESAHSLNPPARNTAAARVSFSSKLIGSGPGFRTSPVTVHWPAGAPATGFGFCAYPTNRPKTRTAQAIVTQFIATVGRPRSARIWGHLFHPKVLIQRHLRVEKSKDPSERIIAVEGGRNIGAVGEREHRAGSVLRTPPQATQIWRLVFERRWD